MSDRYSPAEMMVVSAARRLRDGDRILVGVGMPNLAANLAIRTHAPNAVLIYESGIVGAIPVRLPLSIADSCLVTDAQSICSMFEAFAFYLQNGLIDVGFIGGAQIDRYGNINSTVIGDYEHPKVRLPGSGGACEIASLAKRTIIITPHQKRRLPVQVDFNTSPGFVNGREGRKALGMDGGPEAVVTDLGIMEFDAEGEMVLVSLHPGVNRDEILRNTGWELKVADHLLVTEEPTDYELRIIREELDPQRIYMKVG